MLLAPRPCAPRALAWLSIQVLKVATWSARAFSLAGLMRVRAGKLQSGKAKSRSRGGGPAAADYAPHTTRCQDPASVLHQSLRLLEQLRQAHLRLGGKEGKQGPRVARHRGWHTRIPPRRPAAPPGAVWWDQFAAACHGRCGCRCPANRADRAREPRWWTNHSRRDRCPAE